MAIRTFLNNLKIREKIFFITSLIMIAVCLISLGAFYYVANSYERLLYSEAAEVLNLTSSTVDSELREIEQVSFGISTDPSVQEALRQLVQGEPGYEAYKGRENLINVMEQGMQRQTYYYSMLMYDSLGERYSTVLYNIFPNDRELVRAARSGAGRIVWLPGKENSRMLIAVRQIREMYNIRLRDLGALVIWIDMERLVSGVLDFSQDKRFMILQGEHVVYANHADFGLESMSDYIGKKGFDILDAADGQKYLVAYLTSNYYPDLTYLNILPYEVITQHTERLRNMMILFFAALLLLTLLISRKAAGSITKPLASLLEKIRQVQLGNFEISDTLHENPNMDETGQLHRNFRTMLVKINELFQENYHKELIIQETEYKALQAQINPHFLYNTLDTINWMAKINKQHQIAEMVEALGHMLRSVIGKKGPLVRLEDELSIVRDYIVIQQNRFDDRLDFQLHLDSGIDDCLVPKLTVQPVVENAVQHGLEAVKGVCKIDVTAQMSKDQLQIIVTDNGPGIPHDTLLKIKEGKVESKKTGIGLYNIEERIRLLFGPTYGLNITSEVGEGTSVTITVPNQKGDEHV